MWAFLLALLIYEQKETCKASLEQVFKLMSSISVASLTPVTSVPSTCRTFTALWTDFYSHDVQICYNEEKDAAAAAARAPSLHLHLFSISLQAYSTSITFYANTFKNYF